MCESSSGYSQSASSLEFPPQPNPILILDIKVDYARDMEADSSLPSLFTALEETLGLELRAKKIPVQVLVIDHVDRVPTAN